MQPTDLAQYYSSKGQALPSVAARAPLAAQAGITDAYTGSADQNNTLLAFLTKGSSGSAVINNQNGMMQDTSGLTDTDNTNKGNLDALTAPTGVYGNPVYDASGNNIGTEQYSSKTGAALPNPDDPTKQPNYVGNVNGKDGGTYSSTAPDGFDYTLPPAPNNSKYVYGADGRPYLLDNQGNVSSDPTADAEWQSNKESNQDSDQRNALYDSMKTNLDTAHASLIDSIKSQAATQATDMADINARSLALKKVQGYRTGAAEYTPEINTGILKGEEEEGLTRLAKINSDMNLAVAQAQQAADSDDLDLLSKQMDTVDSLKTAKQNAIQDIYKSYSDNASAIADAKAKLTAQEQAQQTQALTTLKTSAPEMVKEFDSLDEADQKVYIDKMATSTGLDAQTILGAMEGARADTAKAALDAENEESEIANRNKPPAPTAADTAKNQANDIASAVLNWSQMIKDKNWYGVDPTQYQAVVNIIKSQYGNAAVLALQKALKDANLEVDYAGDNEGGNL